MSEYRFFTEGEPWVSTAGFHEHRERAPHLEQPIHQPRLAQALEFVREAVELVQGEETEENVNIVDLGCGDGGLVSQMLTISHTTVHGYDFQPSNVDGWLERGVLLNCRKLSFWNHWDQVLHADVYVATEVLEHVAQPRAVIRRVVERGALMVASSPHTETPLSHDECHAWGWDVDGYREMFKECGMDVIRHTTVGMFQVLLAIPA